MSNSHPDDFGELLLRHPQETLILVQLCERARKNPERPGEAFGRISGTRTREGRVEEGAQTFHVDLNAGLVTITETWDQVATGRRVLPLAAMVEPPPEQAPIPAPPPGPEEASFHHQPFYSADLLPLHLLREWAMKRVDEDLGRLSALPRRIRLFRGHTQEIATLPHPMAPELAPGTGATLRALRTGRRAERALVEGWSATEPGAGVVWIVEEEEDGGFWTAARPFERRPGMLGVWTGPWTEERGAEDPILRALSRADEPAIPLGAPKPLPEPEIGMFFGELPPSETPPDSAEAVCQRVGIQYEAKLFTEPLEEDEARLTVFRGHQWETWVLKGKFPMGLDDTIRAIAARGETPGSLGLTRTQIIYFEGEVYRALTTTGEAAGRRITRALLSRVGADGAVLGHRIVQHDHGAPGHDGWIGVEPVSEFSLFTLNAAEA